MQDGTLIYKTCSKCNTSKLINEFSRRSKFVYRTECKLCLNNCRKKYRDQNKEKMAIYSVEYQKRNADRLRTQKQMYYKANRELLICKQKKYAEINKEHILEYKHKWYQENKEQINVRAKKYFSEHYNSDLLFRLINNICRRIYKSTVGCKVDSSINYLGCKPVFFWVWIKWQLPHDMSFDEFRISYDIDHVRPLASYDLSIDKNKFSAYNWQNCQPLLKRKNYSKGARRNLWMEVIQELKVRVFCKVYKTGIDFDCNSSQE